MIQVTYPCESCADDECGEIGCAKYETAVGLYAAALRLATAIADSPLPEEERRVIAEIFVSSLGQALGLCAARMDRASFMRACALSFQVRP